MGKQRSNTLRRGLLTATFLTVLTVLIFGLTQVETDLTSEDVAAIRSLSIGNHCASLQSYEDEVACVAAVQGAHLDRLPNLTCAHVWGGLSHEPAAFLERGHGCCYDRSRLIEKALTYYGLKVRHLSLHRRNGSLLTYVRSGASHSTSEVLTQRGWMLVDSNSRFLARTTAGLPLDAGALRETLLRGNAKLLSAPTHDYFGGDYYIFYGLYSRHGGFYEPFVPLPDIAWRMVPANFENYW